MNPMEKKFSVRHRATRFYRLRAPAFSAGGGGGAVVESAAMNARWLFPLLLALLGLAARHAGAAEPMMIIATYTYVGDVDPEHPGNERRTRYTIWNTSTASDANNMLYFTLPAGASEGVYDAFPDAGMGDWQFTINQHTTLFTGIGYAVAPGMIGVIDLYSDARPTRLAPATAVARGDTADPNLPFTPVLVEVPADPPPAPGLSGIAPNASLTATNLAWGYAYTLESCPALSASTNAPPLWTNVLTFWATNFPGPTGAQTLPLLPPTNAPAQFYRLRSP